MDNKERIEDLEEEKFEFVFNESLFLFKDENPSWGEVLEAQAEAERMWELTDSGKELASLLSQ